MELTELNEVKMKVMKEVADSNVLLAGMKAELLSLEKEKDLFFTKRENEVLGRIHKLLNNSRILLEETNTNYAQVHEFYGVLKEFSVYVSNIHKGVIATIEDFSEKSKLWQEEINVKEKEAADLMKEIKIDRDSLTREKEFLKKKREEDKTEFERQQVKIQTSYKELQNLWEKMKKTS